MVRSGQKWQMSQNDWKFLIFQHIFLVSSGKTTGDGLDTECVRIKLKPGQLYGNKLLCISVVTNQNFRGHNHVNCGSV